MDIKELFDTPEKVESAISAFKTLELSPAFQLYKLILRQNIKVIDEQTKTLDYMTMDPVKVRDTMIRLTGDRKIYEACLNLSTNFIEKYSPKEGTNEIPNFDPYDTVEDVKNSV